MHANEQNRSLCFLSKWVNMPSVFNLTNSGGQGVCVLHRKGGYEHVQLSQEHQHSFPKHLQIVVVFRS